MMTISGGIISKESNSSVTYKVKCEKCGNIGDSETTVSVAKGVTEVSTKKCLNCGSYQPIKIKLNFGVTSLS